MPPRLRSSQIPGLEPGIFGLILVLFLILRAGGLYGRWRKIRLFFEEFPLYRKATYKRQKQLSAHGAAAMSELVAAEHLGELRRRQGGA